MRIVLISTYDLGRQPFGLASPAAWLRRAGHTVTQLDLARVSLDPAAVAAAALVCFYLPMHTATRLALRLLPQVRALAPAAHVCGYGLYAAMNAGHLQPAGMHTVIAGEFEAELARLAQRLAAGEAVAPAAHTTTARLDFLTPARAGLPGLERYSTLRLPGGATRVTGYTEASRGCKHLCRHCPIVPVYNGKFRVVPAEVVLADIRQQVAAGAEHISFGDPDFFNGITHALRVSAALHREFPALTFDATIKVEHLLRHADRLAQLRDMGCVLVTTAVESFDDRVLAILAKGHTRADFLQALELTRAAGLALNPTFVSFTPWTTVAGFGEMCRLLAATGLARQVAPVQLGIRLLIPAGSHIIGLPDAAGWLGDFDAAGLSYGWKHPDPAVDALCDRVQGIIGAKGDFTAISGLPLDSAAVEVPRFNEAWFCCAEPTAAQFARMML